jgi:MFS family permease
MENEKKFYKRNLRLVLWETVLTSAGAGFSIGTINLFWNSIGMNQADIGLLQMLFTIAIVCLDIPMGYIADRFSRKAVNVIGDFGIAITFLLYMISGNFYQAVLAECCLGLFMAMTNGVDQAFIKYNANKVDSSGELFKKLNTRIFKYRYIMIFIMVAIGGFVAKYSVPLTIGLSFVPYFIGGLVALFIKEIGEKVEVTHKNPIKDMLFNVKEILKTKKMRWYTFAFVLANEVTHAQIWVFTPLMLLVGIPIEIVSLGWILNYTGTIIGSHIGEKLVNFKFSNKFALPMVIAISWMTILGLNVNIVTIWLIALNGFVMGMARPVLLTNLQNSTKDELQASLVSIAATGSRLFYIPLVYVVNLIANNKPQMALIGVVVIFLPLSVITYINLRKIENENKLLEDIKGAPSRFSV